MREFDTIVAGLGAMGSATAYQLARTGSRVLGIDRFAPPHGFGSSHGDTRITRLAIGEGTHYTPLVRRSHEIWRAIERETGNDLMTTTGGLIVSSAFAKSHTHVHRFFQNTLDAARTYGIRHEVLEAGEIRRRFPQFSVADDEAAYFEPDAGFLRVDACVRSQLQLAEVHGADIHTNERVLAVKPEKGAVTVETDKASYRARNVVLALGAWIPDFIAAQFSRSFMIFRQSLHWFDIQDAYSSFAPDRFPVFIWELRDASRAIYGFPAVDGAKGGIKIATEEYEEAVAPDAKTEPTDAREIHRELIAQNFPRVGARCLRSETCLYTVTPDAGFVIDKYPGMDNVIICSACSGHGFKHSAAIGELIAEWITHGQSRIDLSPFRLARFAP